MTTNKEQLKELKEKMGKRFSSKCFFCGTRYSKKGWVFHHRYYLKTDVVYSNYGNDKLQYHKDLEIEIKKNPKRFRYLCNTCHQGFERMMRYGDKKFNKMVKERKATIKLRKSLIDK